MKIFLSYASEQRDLADAVNLALIAQGHDVFFDRDDLPPGGDYNGRIRSAIEASQGMILLISPQSVAHGSYALTELKRAREKWRHPLGCVPSVLAAPTPYSDIPVFLKAVTVLEPEGYLVAEVATEVARRPLGNPRPEIIATLSAVGDELQANAPSLTASRKAEVADYFDHVGVCLEAVHDSLQHDVVPHGRCAELEGYAQMLPATIGDYLGADKAQELSDLLLAAHRVEGLWDELNASPDKRACLPEIAKAGARSGRWQTPYAQAWAQADERPKPTLQPLRRI
jgi:hypothetical protein